MNVLELEHHGKFTAVRVAVELRTLHIRAPCLADRDQRALLERFAAQFPDKFVQTRTVLGDFLIRLLGDLVDDVQTEAPNALIHPP